MHKNPKHPHPHPTEPPAPETIPAPEPVAGLTPAPLSAEAELEALKSEAAKAAEHWDRFVRVTADFDNYRKRAARERQEAIAYANQDLLQKLLPVLDNFEAANAATASATSDDAKSIQSGVTMIFQQLKGALALAGLEEINAQGVPFDPAVHEAISQLESAEVPEGLVLHQTRKGYRLNGRLLRPASVVVARAPVAPAAAE
jgi:molecular chaperone GrpE